MSKYKYTLGKRADVQINVIKARTKTNTRSSGWWTSCKPCPICKSKGKRVYMKTNGTAYTCNICEERNEVPEEKEIGPQEYMRKQEMEK